MDVLHRLMGIELVWSQNIDAARQQTCNLSKVPGSGATDP
jgi:hypothetical protein